jgi:RimJ/RimL family protein N-acetyltransferase
MTFDLQPTLKGDLLVVWPLRQDDYPTLFKVASDPRLWAQHPASDRYKEEVFRDFFRDAIESGGALIVTDNKDGEVIGSSRYHAYAAENRTIEIGWTFLARAYWGGRYNGEVKWLMLNHAFSCVDSVLFLIGPENIRSQKAVEKIGGVHIGSKPGGPGGTSLVFEITASSYRNRIRRGTR